LQESLTNVHRHSGSSTADVRMLVNDGTVVLEISDTGKGIRLPASGQANLNGTAAAGVGLRGMGERMRELGGTLELSSTDGGTTVTATVPVPKAAEEDVKA